jgi:hypothetical protein
VGAFGFCNIRDASWRNANLVARFGRDFWLASRNMKNGPKPVEARPDWHHGDRIGIRTRPSYEITGLLMVMP